MIERLRTSFGRAGWRAKQARCWVQGPAVHDRREGVLRTPIIDGAAVSHHADHALALQLGEREIDDAAARPEFDGDEVDAHTSGLCGYSTGNDSSEVAQRDPE
jgi:hypothetical protein